jgi:hypothetical protein
MLPETVVKPESTVSSQTRVRNLESVKRSTNLKDKEVSIADKKLTSS